MPAANRKTSITFEQIDPISGKTIYRVVSLKNRTVPKIGTDLKEDEVQKLIRESENLTVDIKPSKNKRR